MIRKTFDKTQLTKTFKESFHVAIVLENYNEMIKNLIIHEISKAAINLTINSI